MRTANIVSRASVGLSAPWSMTVEIMATSIAVADMVRMRVP